MSVPSFRFSAVISQHWPCSSPALVTSAPVYRCSTRTKSAPAASVPVDEHAKAQRGEAPPDGLRHNAEIGDSLRRGLLPDGHVAHILQDHALYAAFGQNARLLQRLLRDGVDTLTPVTVAAGQGTGLHHADDSALHAFAPPSFAA